MMIEYFTLNIEDKSIGQELAKRDALRGIHNRIALTQNRKGFTLYISKEVKIWI